MICETCHGQGLMQPGKLAVQQNGVGLLPCEECGGTGYDYCCDPKAYRDMAGQCAVLTLPRLLVRLRRE